MCRRGDVEVWSAGDALQACRHGVCLKSSGDALQAFDVEMFASRAVESCRRCRDVEEFASRTLEMRCRRVDVEEFASRAREMRCRRVDVEYASRVREMRCRRSTWRCRGMQLWNRAAGVGTWRSLPQELWRCAASVASKEVWSAGDALQACRRGEVCLKSSGALFDELIQFAFRLCLIIKIR